MCSRQSNNNVLNVMRIAMVLLVFVCDVLEAEIPRLRGVSLSRITLYDPATDFACFDGSLTIPFVQVNDDYCDCSDGSDEPGTAACSNGVFHCENLGHTPRNIRSSMVNDHVCDCCDGTDEYATTTGTSSKLCRNNCYELGRAAREEADKLAEELRIGNTIRLELSKRGAQMKKEKRERLAELQRNKDEALLLQKEKEMLKNEAERAEEAALSAYRQIEEEQRRDKEAQERIENINEATASFQRFDSNANGRLEIVEIQVRHTFDKDHNGEVTEEEARFFTNEKDEVDLQEFIDECWSKVKPFLMSEQGLFQPPPTAILEDSENGQGKGQQQQQQQHPQNDINIPTDEDSERFEPEDEGVEEEHDQDERGNSEGTEAEEEMEAEAEAETEEEEATAEETSHRYDPETQQLIEIAKAARSEYTNAENGVRNIETDISAIEEYLRKDFGPDDEYATLEGQCFDYEDHEYIYKLCPFDKAVQQPKSSAVAETRLGTWSSWTGPTSNPYASMRYDRGQSCWNGPQRLTNVRVSCATDNQLLSVAEPNRCEYLFEFVTPAACRESSTTNNNPDQLHDEL